MANTKSSVGFNSSSKKKIKPPDEPVLYSHKFFGQIPGDVAVSVEKALNLIAPDYEETTTIRKTFTGQSEEIPFMRYQTQDGIEIPLGTWRVKDIGDVSISLGSGGTPNISMTCMLNDKSSKPLWMKLIETTQTLAKASSIFRGRALQIRDPQDLLVPSPMNLTKSYTTIFNPEIEKDLNTCVMWPLINKDLAKQKGIRVKRGALLDSHYGCGKSLFLYNAAKAAHEAGWTVVNLDAGMMTVASLVAPILAPVCLIVEDVDAGTHGDRDMLNPIINALSSVGTKCADDFVLLVSTNFLSRIDPAILRPERIDAIIHIELPNIETIKRLLRTFINGQLDPTSSLDDAAAALSGCTPAIISEVAQRCLIDSEMNDGAPVTEDSIIFYAKQMEFQKRMAVPDLRASSVGDQLASTLHKVTAGYI